MRRDIKTTRNLTMSTVTCDIKNGCSGDPFRSSSPKNLIEPQLAAAGWTILALRDSRTGDRLPKKYLCPTHRPPSRMSGGPDPGSVLGRSSH